MAVNPLRQPRLTGKLYALIERTAHGKRSGENIVDLGNEDRQSMLP